MRKKRTGSEIYEGKYSIMKYRIHRHFQKGHCILHIINTLFYPQITFPLLFPSVSFILDYIPCLFLKVCCPKCHLNDLPNTRNFAMKFKVFPCFMLSGISFSQQLHSKTSDIERNDN